MFWSEVFRLVPPCGCPLVLWVRDRMSSPSGLLPSRSPSLFFCVVFLPSYHMTHLRFFNSFVTGDLSESLTGFSSAARGVSMSSPPVLSLMRFLARAAPSYVALLHSWQQCQLSSLFHRQSPFISCSTHSSSILSFTTHTPNSKTPLLSFQTGHPNLSICYVKCWINLSPEQKRSFYYCWDNISIRIPYWLDISPILEY